MKKNKHNRAMRRGAGRPLLVLCIALLSLPAAALEAVSHRGANEVAPENTYAAAKAAIERGAAYIEIDVRAAKDGTLYILHDETVDRTTNGTGLLADMTPEKVDALDAGSWFGEEFAGEKVPRLDEYLRWIKGKCGVFLDVKDGKAKKILDLIHMNGMAGEVFLWSGNARLAGRIRELDPDIRIMEHVKSVDAVRDAHEQLNARIIEARLPLVQKKAFQETCAELGLEIMIQMLGDPNPANLRAALASPARYINIDALDKLNRVRAERQEE